MALSLNTRALARMESANPQQAVAQVAQMRVVHSAFRWFHTHERELRQFQLQMVAIPAPPFNERRRAEWLRARFLAYGLQDVEIDPVGNVIGILPGTNSKAKYIAITAHIDTVFPAGTPLNTRQEGRRIFGPGISDNGSGVIGMLAVAAALHAHPVQHSAGLLFIGNVGEEGEGDLRGIRYLFNESKWKDRIGQTLVLDGAGVDSIVSQGLGSKRFEVVVRGPGGHSWADFGAPNPIVALARAATKFSETHVPYDPKTTFNIGVIAGGTSVNSIPEFASMRVDIRSSSAAEMDRLEGILRECVDEAAKAVQRSAKMSPRGNEITYEIKAIGSRPAADLPPDASILRTLQAVDAHLDIVSQARRASTDANIPLAMGREALSIGAGGSGGSAHSAQEWFDPTGRDLGLKRILLTVLTLAGVENK